MQNILARFVRFYWRRYPAPLQGSRVAYITNECILLVKHSYVPGWHFPGGGVRRSESFEQCARREMREEAAYDAQNLKKFASYRVRHRPLDRIDLFVTQDAVPTSAISGMTFASLISKIRSLEITEIKFFPLSQLPHDITPATRKRLSEIQGESTPQNEW